MDTEKYRLLIKEHFIKLAELSEIDVLDDNGPEERAFPEEPSMEQPADVTMHDKELSPSDYPNLGSSITKIASKLSPQIIESLNAEIEKILSTGRSKINHESYVGENAERKNILEYVTSVVGQLFKSVNSDKKRNIRTFLFTAFNPYGDRHGSSSKLARMVARKAGITYDLTASRSIDAEVYMGMIAQAIYEAIDYALKTYSPDQTSFGRWMYMKASGRTIDLINKKEAKTALTGYGKVSGDEPIGGEEGGEETFMTTLTSAEDDFTSEQKEGMKKLYASIGAFVRKALGDNPRYARWLEFYKLFAEQGYSMEDISDITGDSMGNLRITKMRLEKYLTGFVQNGMLPEFIRKKSGIKVKFPNNKFSISMRETGPAAEEPMYIFREDPSLPEGGEWVEMDRPKKYKKYIKDYLADIAFGKEEGEEIGEEERLAEIRTVVKVALLNEYYSPQIEFIRKIRDIISEYLDMHVSVKSIKQALNDMANSVEEIAIKKINNPGAGNVFQEEAEDVDEERIINPESGHYVRNKENFIGSHVWGEALNDGSYVAVSYGEQFPIYIYWADKDKWYENADKYIYDGEPQESTDQHKEDLRPTEETRKKPAEWMKKLLRHLKKVNGIKTLEHLSVEPGEKN